MQLIDYDMLKPKPEIFDSQYHISDKDEIILEDEENP